MGRKAKHILNLLSGVFFTAAEDIGLAAFCVAYFVDLGLGKDFLLLAICDMGEGTYHGTIGDKSDECIWWD